MLFILYNKFFASSWERQVSLICLPDHPLICSKQLLVDWMSTFRLLYMLQHTSANARRLGNWSFPSGQRAISSTGRLSTICTWAVSSRAIDVNLHDDTATSGIGRRGCWKSGQRAVWILIWWNCVHVQKASKRHETPSDHKMSQTATLMRIWSLRWRQIFGLGGKIRAKSIKKTYWKCPLEFF